MVEHYPQKTHISQRDRLNFQTAKWTDITPGCGAVKLITDQVRYFKYL